MQEAKFYVTDYGVSLATGETTQSALLAAMARLPLMKADPSMPLLRPGDDESHLPVQLTCFENLELLWEAANELVQSKLARGHSVLLMLPDPAEPQAKEITLGISDCLNSTGVISVYPGHMFTEFEQVLEQLQQGDIEQLTCIGIDSLVNQALMAQWLQRGRLRTQQHPDGRAVGEGIGWFTLSLQPGESTQIQFSPGASTTEPVHHQSQEYQGLALSVAPLFQSRLTAAPDTWVYSRCQTPEDMLQAFMGFQYHWGNKQYKNLEQLFPARQLGDLGVAALPVAIAIACARLTFEPYPKNTAIVSDSHPDGQHFSVLLHLAL